MALVSSITSFNLSNTTWIAISVAVTKLEDRLME
jgi:hypothetical protein